MGWKKAAFVVAMVLIGITGDLWYLSYQGRVVTIQRAEWNSLNEKQKQDVKTAHAGMDLVGGTAGAITCALFDVIAVGLLGWSIAPRVRIHATLRNRKPFPFKDKLEDGLAVLYGVMYGVALITYAFGIAVFGPDFAGSMGIYLFMLVCIPVITALSLSVEIEERRIQGKSGQGAGPQKPMLPLVLKGLGLSALLSAVAHSHSLAIDRLVLWSDSIKDPPTAASLQQLAKHVGALSIVSGVLFGIMALLILKLSTFGAEKRPA